MHDLKKRLNSDKIWFNRFFLLSCCLGQITLNMEDVGDQQKKQSQ